MPVSDNVADLAHADLSRVIGLIYDCAVDPALWPKALEAACGLVGATVGSILLHDPSNQKARSAYYWGEAADFDEQIRTFEQTYSAMMPFHGVIGELPVGQAVNTAMLMQRLGSRDFYDSRFFKEWAEPAGLKDVATVVLLKSEQRACVLNLNTSTERDLVGPRELAICDLLAPHARRAVLIADLLEMTALETSTLRGSLDLLSAAVVLADSAGNVLHANAVARGMASAGDPIAIRAHRLVVSQDEADRALRRAIEIAVRDEVSLGGAGIAVPVPFADGRPAIAHVLPLSFSPRRSSLVPSAAVAVFITACDVPPAPVEAIAALYDLTLAESRVLESIVSGRNQAETADHLGVAESTVKTHLGRIFSKTGTASQSELASLAHGLASPATQANSRRD